MPQISEKKKDKIKENILSTLFHASPNALFTAQISEILARDEEFILKLLHELKKQELVADVKKNVQGISYSRRIKWRLSNKAYSAYREINDRNNKNFVGI